MFVLKTLFALLLVVAVMSDNMWFMNETRPTTEDDATKLASSTGGPYTYSQSAHHFTGTGYDGSYIDTRGACSGQSGSCRDNPSCQCKQSVGPLPQGSYTLGNMFTFKGMPYW